MPFLENYKEILKSSNLPLEETKDGYYTLLHHKKYIHSKFSVEKEIQKHLKNLEDSDPSTTLVIVYGVGFAYILDSLEKKGFTHLIVLEEDETLFNNFIKIYDTKHLYLISPQDQSNDIEYLLADLNFTFYTINSVKEIKLLGTYDAHQYQKNENLICKLLAQKQITKNTTVKFSKIWTFNFIRNLSMFNGILLKDFLSKYKLTTPILLCSAGPSLDYSMKWIKKNQSSFTILAVDTIFSKLVKADIIPDFVFVLDAQSHSLKHFLSVPKKVFEKVVLVYDCFTNHKLVSLFSKKIMFVTAHLVQDTKGNKKIETSPLIKIFQKELSIKDNFLESGGSVATSAFHFSALISKQIYLIGQDLAYTDYKTHALETASSKIYMQSSSFLKPLSSLAFSTLKKMDVYLVEGIQNKVYTDSLLESYVNWFKISILNLEKLNYVKVINLTVNGIKINKEGQKIFFDLTNKVQKENLSISKINIKQKEDFKLCLKKLSLLLKDSFLIDNRNLENEFSLFLISYFTKDILKSEKKIENLDKYKLQKINILLKVMEENK